MKATLIQCTDSKRDHKTFAKELYDESPYFRDMRAWAEALETTRDQPWFILSAKHGLLWPDVRVEPYNDTGLSSEQSREIAGQLASIGVHSVDLTAGMAYTDPLVPELENRGIDVVNHFAGERIGTRMNLLQSQTEKILEEGP